MRIKVFYHDKCFDGACSAALFTRFYHERIRQHADFEYQGLVHRAGALFNEDDFTGDENAIVDFKYSSSPRITWWFDHHQSAFLTPDDASHFEQELSNTKFYDPDFRSCTKFIASVTEQRFGFNPAPVAELIEWADIIDGALYDDPQSAVEMKAPAMKLTMVIESNQDPHFIPEPDPDSGLQTAGRDHRPACHCRAPTCTDGTPRALDRDSARSSQCKEGTIFFDLTDYDLEGYNKFIPYYLHPTVRVQRGPEQEQLSHQSLRRLQSLDHGDPHGEPGEDLRALRRRRTCPGRGHFIPAEQV